MFQRVALTIMLFFVSISLANAFQVPDTGIEKCFDAAGNQLFPCPGPGQAYYGQDGNYVLNGMNFTDHANGTLTDNITHLLWQKTANGTTRTWDAAVAYCNTLNSNPSGGLGGHASGWRVPTLVELGSILDLSVESGAAISPVFAGTAAASYWTSNVDPDNSANAWILGFGTTEDGIVLKSELNHVRCVWTGVAP